MRRLLSVALPIGFIVGASMEVFMYYTGFWSVATKKAAERRDEERRALSAGTSSPSTPRAW